MKYIKTSFFVLPILACYLFSQAFFMIPKSQASENIKAQKVPDEILVKFINDSSINVIKIADTRDFDKILNNFKKNPIVDYAEPNYTYKAAMIPSDTYFSDQWYLQKIKATSAWDTIRESTEITIAILDSGVQINHPDLKDNIWVNKGEVKDNNKDDDNNGFMDDVNGWDFVNNLADPSPKFKEGFTEAGIKHGTVVAGVAAASSNNAAGITGVTWKAKIMPIKVLDDKGEGNASNVIRGIDYAITNGVNIINLSFVGFGFSRSLDDAIKRAYDAGIIIVAAAGNEQENGDGYSLDSSPMYPVCYDGSREENRVIGVAATDTLDQKALFSSYGFSCVDIAAPGLGIYSTVVYSPTHRIGNQSFDKYYDGYWAGTSMATPIISASIALIEAVNPSLNRKEVIYTLLSTADNINKLNPLYLNQLGKGRVNLYSAVNSAKEMLDNKNPKLLVSPLANRVSIIKETDVNGKPEGKDLIPYGENFKGGVNIASGDINGDGINEIVTGPGKGGGPHIKIFDQAGTLRGHFFAYNQLFRGGVKVAVADVDGDGISDIITGAGSGGGPHVKVFDSRGKMKYEFFAYMKTFIGGVNIAAGDVDGDGLSEIITAPGPGGGPQVKIFRGDGNLKKQFFAYSTLFRSGVNVAVGDIDGGVRGNKAEIITSPEQGGGPHIKIFNSQAVLLGQFFAYNSLFRGGVEIASGDVNNDGLAEIVTGAGPGGSPHVRVFNRSGGLLGSFYAFETEFSGGVNVGIVEAAVEQ